MISIFEALQDNQSLIDLNLSTVDGVARNRLAGSAAIAQLKTFLHRNEFLELLDLSSVGLGNEGLEALCEVLSPAGAPLNQVSRLDSNKVEFAFEKHIRET
jgi:hypothetical protein